MRPLPTCKLSPKVKSVWRLSALLTWGWFVLVGAVLAIVFAAIGNAILALSLGVSLIVVGAVLLLAFAVIAPPIRHARWSYEVGEHELDIVRGILWRKRFMIPFIRVQNTDTKQGPIMRAFGLASVTVATAAGEHEIPGLPVEEADALRDAIATQARLAREDV